MVRKLSYQSFYNGELRPEWARDVDIKTRVISLPSALSAYREGRKAHEVISDLVRVPDSISATILPTKTSGRKTVNAEGQVLKYTRYDRGHLLAYSLGAPKTSDIMFAQSRFVNQKSTRGGYERCWPEQLSWKAMEVYIRFIASKGLMGADRPMPTDVVEVDLNSKPNRVSVNDYGWEEMPQIQTSDYQDAMCFPDRTFGLKYIAECNYSAGYRSDFVRSIDLRIDVYSFLDSFNGYILFAADYGNEDPASVEDRYLEEEERRIERRAVAYGPERQYKTRQYERINKKTD